jgi:hypothetical protein
MQGEFAIGRVAHLRRIQLASQLGLPVLRNQWVREEVSERSMLPLRICDNSLSNAVIYNLFVVTLP